MCVHLPCRVPVSTHYTLVDLYFACAMMEKNMDAFVDDYKILPLKVITTSPSNPPQPNWAGKESDVWQCSSSPLLPVVVRQVLVPAMTVCWGSQGRPKGEARACGSCAADACVFFHCTAAILPYLSC